MTYDIAASAQAERFLVLLDWGVITQKELRAAEQTARARGIELERVLANELGIPKTKLLAALADFYACPSVEYDERMPIPPDLLASLDGERLSLTQWFPIIHDKNTVIIAAHDPRDPLVLEEARRSINAERYELWVALEEDIQWFIQDYLHARPGALIGTERTGLAYWRNTMAHWRTRLACYRNDLAQGRTDLAFLRWGLGLIALATVLLRTNDAGRVVYGSWFMTAAGIALGIFGLKGYLRVRRTRMRAPGHHTLVEVTSATMQFLENYHDLSRCTLESATKKTMLSRLNDCIGGYSTILYPQPASRERTHLARERNVLSAQRTVAACYRTIYARARTGLAFIRTGVSFAGLGLGLLSYFAYGWATAIDVLLIAAGCGMAVDGMLWYWPVRQEQAEVPRCTG